MDHVVNEGGNRHGILRLAVRVLIGVDAVLMPVVFVWESSPHKSQITHGHCTKEASHQEKVGHLAFCGLSGGVPMGARHSHLLSQPDSEFSDSRFKRCEGELGVRFWDSSFCHLFKIAWPDFVEAR